MTENNDMSENQDSVQPHDGDHFDRELEKLLSEAEETVVRVRRVLESRRENAAQHAEIDRLEEHMAATRVRWAEVRNFFETVLREFVSRDGRDPASPETKEGDQDRA